MKCSYPVKNSAENSVLSSLGGLLRDNEFQILYFCFSDSLPGKSLQVLVAACSHGGAVPQHEMPTPLCVSCLSTYPPPNHWMSMKLIYHLSWFPTGLKDPWRGMGEPPHEEVCPPLAPPATCPASLQDLWMSRWSGVWGGSHLTRKPLLPILLVHRTWLSPSAWL